MPGLDQWPEFYGFAIWGGGPCYVISVEKGSIADEAGLLPGDQLLELDGDDVSGNSAEEVKLAARRRRLPGAPTVGVVSRIQTMEIPFNRRLGYGFAMHGSRPIVVSSVNPYGPSYQAGLREGDVVLQINGYHVTSPDVVETILAKAEKIVLGILVTAKGDGSVISSSAHHGRRSRDNKAKELFTKLNRILGGDNDKKMYVVGLMKQYAEDRNVHKFAGTLQSLLSAPEHRPIVQEIRAFVPDRHLPVYDRMLTQDPLMRASTGSMESLKSTLKSAYQPTLMSEIPVHFDTAGRRTITIDRSQSGSFGFILRGNRPVFVESVELNGCAARSGLQPGDCILRLNGLDVSQCGHNHLVELLQNSGSKPTLEVCQTAEIAAAATTSPQSNGHSHQPRHQKEPSFSSMDFHLGNPDEAPSSGHSLGYDESGKSFKDRVDELLTKSEKVKLKDALEVYRKSKGIERFAADLSRLFDTPSKQSLWPYLLPKLPREHRNFCAQHAPMSPLSSAQIKQVSSPDRQLPRAHSTPSLQQKQQQQQLLQEPKQQQQQQEQQQQQLDHLTSFKHQLEYLLTSRERARLKKALQHYSTHREVNGLIVDVSAILDTPSKKSLWMYIVPLLSPHHQNFCREKLGLPVSVGTSRQPGRSADGTGRGPGARPRSSSRGRDNGTPQRRRPVQQQQASSSSLGGRQQQPVSYNPFNQPHEETANDDDDEDFKIFGRAASLLRDGASSRGPASVGRDFTSSSDDEFRRSVSPPPHQSETATAIGGAKSRGRTPQRLRQAQQPQQQRHQTRKSKQLQMEGGVETPSAGTAANRRPANAATVEEAPLARLITFPSYA